MENPSRSKSMPTTGANNQDSPAHVVMSLSCNKQIKTQRSKIPRAVTRIPNNKLSTTRDTSEAKIRSPVVDKKTTRTKIPVACTSSPNRKVVHIADKSKETRNEKEKVQRRSCIPIAASKVRARQSSTSEIRRNVNVPNAYVVRVSDIHITEKAKSKTLSPKILLKNTKYSDNISNRSTDKSGKSYKEDTKVGASNKTLNCAECKHLGNKPVTINIADQTNQEASSENDTKHQKQGVIKHNGTLKERDTESSIQKGYTDKKDPDADSEAQSEENYDRENTANSFRKNKGIRVKASDDYIQDLRGEDNVGIEKKESGDLNVVDNKDQNLESFNRNKISKGQENKASRTGDSRLEQDVKEEQMESKNVISDNKNLDHTYQEERHEAIGESKEKATESKIEIVDTNDFDSIMSSKESSIVRQEEAIDYAEIAGTEFKKTSEATNIVYSRHRDTDQQQIYPWSPSVVPGNIYEEVEKTHYVSTDILEFSQPKGKSLVRRSWKSFKTSLCRCYKVNAVDEPPSSFDTKRRKEYLTPPPSPRHR